MVVSYSSLFVVIMYFEGNILIRETWKKNLVTHEILI